jgi:hypothetical protein
MGTVAYLVGIYFLTQYYGYNGAAMSLFLLLTPMPYFYLWVERNVGHKFSEYLLLTGLFVVSGLLVILTLWKIHSYLSSDLLIILVDGLVLTGVVGGALLYLFREKLRLRFG